MHVLVTFKNGEDQIKDEGARQSELPRPIPRNSVE